MKPTKFFSFVLLITAAACQSPAPKVEQPPLIDRELLFDAPEIAGGQISPDGKFISFIKPYKGTQNIWIKKLEEDFTAAKPITADTIRPIRSFMLLTRWKRLLQEVTFR